MAQRTTDRIDAGSTTTLAIPADPAYVGTVRYFAATIARHEGLPEELIDDLRLAVSEACAEAIDCRGDRIDPRGLVPRAREDRRGGDQWFRPVGG